MKVCLIFSPFSSLSYIPLGIAYLKSYIEKNIPAVSVRNLDLANDFYHQLDKEEFLSCLSPLCRICPHYRTPQCKGMLKKEASGYWMKPASVSNAWITDSKNDEFYNTAKYNKLRRVYDFFYGGMFYCVNSILRSSLEDPNEENNNLLENSIFKADIDKIVSEAPDVVGFSIFSEKQLYYSLALAKMLKARINPRIVFGGAYIAHLDKKTMLRMFDFLDFIIYKEGESGIVELLKNLKTRRFSQVPNLVYRKGGKIIENRDSAVRHLDRIPFPDFSDFRLKKYFTPQPVLSILFSRGCSWGACTFCAHRKSYSQPYRTRPIPDLIRELERYQKKGIKQVCFTDEIISAKDLDLISSAMLKKKIKMSYAVMLKPTGDFTRAILEKIYKAGCRVVIWGVESFDQRILDLMNKGTNAGEIEELLKISGECGLHNCVYMIQGFPTQTQEDIARDVKFLKRNLQYINDITVHRFWLEAGTDIFRNRKKLGLKHLKRSSLLKTKRYNLFSPEFSFTSKEKIDWVALSRTFNDNLKAKEILERNTRLQGILFPLEHILLYAAHGKKQSLLT